MRRKGFTSQQPGIAIVMVVILIAIAVPQFGKARAEAARASLKNDLEALVKVERVRYARDHHYATIGNLGRDYLAGRNNTVLTYKADSVGLTAIGTSTKLTRAPKTCGVYLGPPSYAPSKTLRAPGTPGCW